ncbi:MAG: redox-regulated ATPase YchF [Mycoplasmoidaceae bacterium]|nr:MAG: redox-regulated ATPase YchF [Mycoplasmoidaceae bacterium]
MNLSAGIVGLPNVGKSTLFNTLTNLQVEAANYPFATIEPNVGTVKVWDERLIALGKLINPIKLTPATCSFTDIAGLIKGASKGEGLGNQFLANIRETDAICHVVRCFSDNSITHVMDGVDPIRDIEIINTELIIADLDSLEKKWPKIISASRSGKPEAVFEENVAKKVMDTLKANKFIDLNAYTSKEQEIINKYNLITTKPVLYVANIDESDISNPEQNINYKKVLDYAKGKSLVIPLAIAMEFEISKLSDEEKIIFLKDMNIKEAGVNKLINKTYELLNIQTFFTFGPDETKAWSFKKGMTACQCAGIIHTDIQKGFIRAEVTDSKDLINLGSEIKVKENGKLRIEGKDYMLKDGDVCYFRFNVSK